MAHRPVFVPSINRPWVRRETVEFTWHPGLSVCQKQKSIASLHAAASSMLQVSEILEISSKAPDQAGIAASAFNLKIRLSDGTLTTLECAYQGSKKFDNGGPYTDIYRASSLDAKRDERVRRKADRLLAFEFFGDVWPLEPQSLFYDWLYISALMQPQNEALLSELLRYHAFTDIALAGLVGGRLQILDMHVEQSRSGGFKRLNNIDSGPHGVAHVHAKTHARIPAFDGFEHRLGSRKVLVFRSVVVKRSLNIEFLDKLFD